MFKGKKASSINPNTTDTVIGEGTVFEGRIRSEASVRIEGTINGDVESKGDVIIGEKGSVKSNISARNVIVAGVVNGHITAKEKLHIMSSGQLTGNAAVASLVIEEGALFSGNSRMESKAAAAKEAPAEKEPNGSKPFPGGSFGGDTISL